MCVCRHFVRQQRDAFGTERLAEQWLCKSRSGADSAGCGTLKIGQAVGGGAVAAVRCAEQREKCGVLLDSHDLTSTECPVGGSKLEGVELNFTQVRFTHDISPEYDCSASEAQLWLGKTPAQAMQNRTVSVGMRLSWGKVPPVMLTAVEAIATGVMPATLLEYRESPL